MDNNKRFQKALMKTLDDFGPLIAILVFVAGIALFVGLIFLLGFWSIPVIGVIVIGLRFWYNYAEAT